MKITAPSEGGKKPYNTIIQLGICHCNMYKTHQHTHTSMFFYLFVVIWSLNETSLYSPVCPAAITDMSELAAATLTRTQTFFFMNHI